MESTAPRRRHSAGEATRELLMVTAERLIAMNGVEGVSLREIQAAAGQSNSSVITYHFGSQAGLVRAVLEFRYRTINARRAELLQEARDRGVSGDPREAVWIIVRPLIESIDAGEMFVPFLARVSANPRTFAEYLPPEVADSTAGVLREMLPGLHVGHARAGPARPGGAALQQRAQPAGRTRARPSADQRGAAEQLRGRLGGHAHRADVATAELMSA